MKKLNKLIICMHLVLLLTFSAGVVALTGEKVRADASATAGANLILISLDTLRADRLGCYGYKAPTSPMLDALAEKGIRFETAIAESSWTLPSHMTLFTGLYPSTHGVTVPARRLNPSIPTLTQVLRSNGYRCYANTGGGFVRGEYGFDRDFEMYINLRAGFHLTLNHARKWLQKLPDGDRFFLFLHTYAIHCPYHPREEYSRMFRTTTAADYIETQGKCGNPHFNSMQLEPGQVRYLSDQYDGSIRETDDLLRNFFEFIEGREDAARTIIVVTSDHGEEFLEYGQIGHERTLSPESLLVPLIIYAPGFKPRVVTQPVGLVNIMPTLLELVGVPAPRMQGRSLLSLMLGDADLWKDSPQYSELDRHLVLRSIVWKGRSQLILDNEGKIRTLYDLSRYPGRQVNLVQQQPALAARLEKMVKEHFKGLPDPAVFLADTPTQDRINELKSLGYVN